MSKALTSLNEKQNGDLSADIPIEDALVEISPVSEEDVNFDTYIDRTDLGAPDTLRHNVLSWVIDQNYDNAISDLKNYLTQDFEYPDYKNRIIRYINHSVDLIYAIKAKRTFPGINSLTRAKQQELREKFKTHFDELKFCLKKVEKIKTDLRIQDARSTIFVIRAFWYSIVAVIIFAFMLDIHGGLANTIYVVSSDAVAIVTDWFIKKAGL